MTTARQLAAVLCAAALFVLPNNAAAAKVSLDPAEAVEAFAQVCLQSDGDKQLAEQIISQLPAFDFVQSTESQSVAEHDEKELSFLLLQIPPALTCILRFQADGDLIENFYSVRALVAAELDVAETAFAEEGAQVIYRTEQQDILIRPTNGISIAVSYK